jgi:hypothetical protein
VRGVARNQHRWRSGQTERKEMAGGLMVDDLGIVHWVAEHGVKGDRITGNTDAS